MGAVLLGLLMLLAGGAVIGYVVYDIRERRP